MKKSLFLFLTVFTVITSYAQITFDKGYYINNSNQKIECFIKNVDWKNNPIDFEYKLSENSPVKTANLKTVKEFEIYNESKYFKSIVKIDKSSELIGHLSNNKNPLFEEEELFLKVLIEGKATLYSYENGKLRRYFYTLENSPIEQLIFKNYKTADNKIGKNNRFKQQLWRNLKCASIKTNSLRNLRYNKNSLIDFFTRYNECNNTDFIIYEKKQKKDFFNLTLRPRLSNTSLSVRNNSYKYRKTDFGSKMSFGFGIEAEFILPFNKDKWRLLIEPTYQSFKGEKTNYDNKLFELSTVTLKTAIDYSSIEIPIGLRHYFFFNEDSNLFINASYVIDLTFKSSMTTERIDNNSSLPTLDIKTFDNLAFGMGYQLYNKYSMEIRYQTGRDLLTNYTSWFTDYSSLSVIFGYSIF